MERTGQAEDPADGIPAVLLPGELLLWEGSPRQGLWVTWFDAPLVLVGFVLSLVGIGELFGRSAAVGIPVSIVGLYLFLGQFFVDARVRRSTRYVLTDRRSLVVRRWPRPSVSAVDLRLITRCTVEWIDIHLATIDLADRPGRFRWLGPLRPWSPALRGVSDPSSLVPLIRGETVGLAVIDRGRGPG